MADAPLQAQSADGVIHQFPAGTDMSVVDRVMKSYAADGPQPAAPDPSEHWAAPAGGEFGNLQQFNDAKGLEIIPQSAIARLSGTDRPPAATPDAGDTWDSGDTIAPGLRNALAPAANTTYGSILPFARDDTTGDVRLALPSSLRDLATGGLDLMEGTVTPAATNLLANVALGGGMTPSLARGTGAAIRDTVELGAPAADLYRPRITATEIQARDGVGIMEAWNRAHTENNAAAIAKIGQATDIDGVIAAAGRAAEVPGGGSAIPAGWSVDDRFGPTPGVDATANPTGDVLGAGDLWRTDPDQLQSMLAEKGLSDRQKTVRALGSEAAAIEFYRLDRKQNSDLPWVADEGAREFDAKFGNLTPNQERLIYGVGETGAQADDIQQVLDAHNNRTSDPTDAGYEAAIAIRGVPAAEIKAVPEGNASPMAQAAYVRLKNAYEDMRASGVAPEQVASTIAKALVDRGGWSPGDAAEVVGNFVEQMRQGAAAPAPAEASPYARITTGQVQARDGVGAVEASRRAAAENAAGAPPVPESVGAAASRDMTHPGLADISTADMRANRRVAEQGEILRPPQANDNTVYVDGSFPTLAERSGDPVLSQYENLLRERNPGEFVGEGKRLTENNKARIAEFDRNTVPDTTLNSMLRDRDARFSAASDDILPTAKPADLTPALDWVQEQLSNPRIQENDAVRGVLEDFRDRIVDDGGNLKTDPAAVWGMHDHLQNLLAKAKDPLNATGSEKFAQSQILKMKQLIDQSMNVATDNRFQSALDRYAEDSKAINAGVLFNDFRPKLTNMTGDLQAANFHNFVKGLAKERGDPGIDPSMDISDSGMRSMINIDNDLKRAGLIKLGSAAGSQTNLLGALAQKAGLDAAHSVVGKIPLVGGALSVGQKYLADRKMFADTAKHLAPPEGGYIYPEPEPPARP